MTERRKRENAELRKQWVKARGRTPAQGACRMSEQCAKCGAASVRHTVRVGNSAWSFCTPCWIRGVAKDLFTMLAEHIQ